MKTTRASLLLLGLSLLGSWSSVATAKEVVLKTQSALPRTHDLSKSFFKSFIDKINVAGKGAIRVRYVGGPEINSPDKAAAAVRPWTINMLHAPTAYHAGIMP